MRQLLHSPRAVLACDQIYSYITVEHCRHDNCNTFPLGYSLLLQLLLVHSAISNGGSLVHNTRVSLFTYSRAEFGLDNPWS